MALDPTISLGVRPPVIPQIEIQTPLERFARVLSLKNLMNQSQAGDIGLQSKQLELEQTKRLADQRQRYADYLSQHMQGAAAAPPAVSEQPAQAEAPAPNAMLPGIILPPTPPVATPGAPLNALMAPQPAAKPTPAPAAPPAAKIPSTGLDFSRLNFGEMISQFPDVAPDHIKTMMAMEEMQSKAATERYNAAAKKAEGLGRAGISVRDAKDPAAAFGPALMQAVSDGYLDEPTAQQMIHDGYAKHAPDIQRFVDASQNAKDSATTAKTNVEAQQKARENAAATVGVVGDQAGWDKWLPQQTREVQSLVGPTYSPQLKDVVQNWGVSAADQPKAEMAQRAADAQVLAAAFARGPAAVQAKLAEFGPKRAAPFTGVTSVTDIMQRALSPEQATTAAQAAANAAETAKQHAAENLIAQGHLKIAARADNRAEQVYQNTYGPGANEALVGVEPKLRVQATGAAQKASDEYAKAAESTNNMKSIIDLARSGNKIAYAYAPTTGVLTINTAAGVKRINTAEIKQYGGAGSAMDRIEGWLGKQTTGASIPKDILDNMEQVNKTISDSAASTYNSKLDSINQNYHANFKPTGQSKAAAPAGAGKAPAATNPNPNGYVAGHVYGGMKYLGGDPNKRESWQ